MIYRITAGDDDLEYFLNSEVEADLESLWNEMIDVLKLEKFDSRWTPEVQRTWTTGRNNALKVLYFRLTNRGFIGHDFVATRTFVEYLKSKGFTEALIADYWRE